MSEKTTWVERKVGDCLLSISFRSKNQIQAREYKLAGQFPVIDQGQSQIAGRTDDESSVISSPLPLVIFGDHTRALKFIDFPFARGGDGTQVLVPVSNLDCQFFYYACKHIDVPARGYNRHFTLLRESAFFCPENTVIQREIGQFLRLIDDAIDQEAAHLVLAIEIKQVTMNELFARGLRGEAQKETDIGPMPQSWNPKSILELCDIWSGGTPRKSVAEYWSGEIPWVSGKDLKLPALDDVIDHISVAGVDAGSRIAPKGAVLLLVRGMGLAKDLPVAVIKRPMAFNQDVKALVTRGQYSGEFLRSAIYAGKDRLLSQIVPSAHGTMTLNLNDVESFKIACPSDNDEAAEIVTMLDVLDQKIALHQQKKSVLNELFRSLLHKLMTGEISFEDLDLSALTDAEPQPQTEAEVKR